LQRWKISESRAGEKPLKRLFAQPDVKEAGGHEKNGSVDGGVRRTNSDVYQILYSSKHCRTVREVENMEGED